MKEVQERPFVLKLQNLHDKIAQNINVYERDEYP
jgi:hypothetical protein